MNVYFLLNGLPSSEVGVCTFSLHYFAAYDVRLREPVEEKDNFCGFVRAVRTNSHRERVNHSLPKISPPQAASSPTSWTT